jgi:3-oxoacyl-[acyl-carrier-protein] synthase I
MKKKFTNIIADNVISSLGFGSQENFSALENNISGVKIYNLPNLDNLSLPLGKLDENIFSEQERHINNREAYTRFEKLIILSITDALKKTSINPSSKDTIIIISTTKGNVDLINDEKQREKLSLWYSAQQIAKHFNAANTPMVVCNACISGVLALIQAHRLLSNNIFKHAIVVGADVLSDFVISGFNSFKSLSPGICMPFDEKRDGLNIGEGAATIVLSNEIDGDFSITSGASANDANHISGPSRNGEGLYQSIMHTISKNELIDYVSAHGTATPYNDDMESIAITRASLNNIYVNSYKAYIGHTLGAAGVIESVFSLWSMKNNLLIKSLGCNIAGVVEPINIIQENTKKKINKTLKMASGFGGCNATMVIKSNG